MDLRTPDVDPNIRPPVHELHRGPGTLRRSHSGLGQRDLHSWLEDVSPEHREDLHVTRSGRVSKPPRRYSYSREEKREAELKELAQAKATLKAESQKSQAAKSSQRRTEPVASTSSRLLEGAGRNAPAPAKSKTTASRKSAPPEKPKSTWSQF